MQELNLRKMTILRDLRHGPTFKASWASNTRAAAFRVPQADRNESVGLNMRIGEGPKTVLCKVQRRADPELRSIAAGRETCHDLAVVDRQRDRTVMRHQNHRRNDRPGRRCPEDDRPGQNRNPRPLQGIRHRDLRIRPWQNSRGRRLQSRRNRPASIQVDQAVYPDLPWSNIVVGLFYQRGHHCLCAGESSHVVVDRRAR